MSKTLFDEVYEGKRRLVCEWFCDMDERNRVCRHCCITDRDLAAHKGIVTKELIIEKQEEFSEYLGNKVDSLITELITECISH